MALKMISMGYLQFSYVAGLSTAWPVSTMFLFRRILPFLGSPHCFTLFSGMTSSLRESCSTRLALVIPQTGVGGSVVTEVRSGSSPPGHALPEVFDVRTPLREKRNVANPIMSLIMSLLSRRIMLAPSAPESPINCGDQGFEFIRILARRSIPCGAESRMSMLSHHVGRTTIVFIIFVLYGRAGSYLSTKIAGFFHPSRNLRSCLSRIACARHFRCR
ncbi:hypothetical protein EJ08DRAFT_417603 [Tothia fuscella]|uniref:Uncharacterized protein n=1 Tax=Tothia fuscella TaxID=1048955 RepID=A0A9P4NJN0_9PEZI|nr:hypothetical protein EJ08DRAFT_417603 [Tothia fuscella]